MLVSPVSGALEGAPAFEVDEEVSGKAVAGLKLKREEIICGAFEVFGGAGWEAGMREGPAVGVESSLRWGTADADSRGWRSLFPRSIL